MESRKNKQAILLHDQKGSLLLFSIVILGTLLAIGLGANTMVVLQLRESRGVADSVFAFGAAEAGVERILYVDKTKCATISLPYPPSRTDEDFVNDVLDCMNDEIVDQDLDDLNNPPALANNATYTVSIQEGQIVDPGGECLGQNYCSRSEGRFSPNATSKESVREIRISR